MAIGSKAVQGNYALHAADAVLSPMSSECKTEDSRVCLELMRGRKLKRKSMKR